MKSVFIPPEVLSKPAEMQNPVMKHHRIDLRTKGERRHLSTAFPEMRQLPPDATHMFSIFAPRLAKTESVKKGLRDSPEAIIALEKMNGKL